MFTQRISPTVGNYLHKFLLDWRRHLQQHLTAMPGVLGVLGNAWHLLVYVMMAYFAYTVVDALANVQYKKAHTGRKFE